MEDENINNEDQTQSEEDADTGLDADQLDDTADEGDAEKEGDEGDDKLPFHKHPRWQEVTGDLKEAKASNEKLVSEITQLRSMIERLGKTADGEVADEIASELEAMESDRPKTYRELFDRFQKLQEKVAAKQKAKSEEDNKAQHEATVRELSEQLAELVELGRLDEKEIKEFTSWCADELDKGKSKRIYGNFHAALPYWRDTKKEDTKDRESDKNRRGIGPSGASDSEVLKVKKSDLSNLSLVQALERSQKASKSK